MPLNSVLLADLISIFYIPLLNPSAKILNKTDPVTDVKINQLIRLRGAVEGMALTICSPCSVHQPLPGRVNHGRPRAGNIAFHLALRLGSSVEE